MFLFILHISTSVTVTYLLWHNDKEDQTASAIVVPILLTECSLCPVCPISSDLRKPRVAANTLQGQ